MNNSDRNHAIAFFIKDKNYDSLLHLLRNTEFYSEDYVFFYEILIQFPTLHMNKKNIQTSLQCMYIFIDNGFNIFEKNVLDDNTESLYEQIKSLKNKHLGGAHKYAEWLPLHLNDYCATRVAYVEREKLSTYFNSAVLHNDKKTRL